MGEWLLHYSESRMDEIERKYSTDSDRLQGAVQQWLEGGGLTQPSWRRLVLSLDLAGDTIVADPIRGFAEPPPGESS